jgi:hypothetical protein
MYTNKDAVSASVSARIQSFEQKIDSEYKILDQLARQTQA